MAACTSKNSDIQEIILEEVPLSIRETDSIVVANLINQSQTYYNNNITTATAFDEYLKEAEDIALKNNFKVPLSNIYHLVSKRHRNRSEYGIAIQYATKALDLGKEINDQSLLSNYLNMAAVIYRRVDENSQAMELHMQALEIAESINDSFQVGIAYNGVGNVYLGLARFRAAMQYFKKSFEIAEVRGNVLGQAINANNIGEALKNLGQLDSALVYFYQSLDYNTQIDSEVGQAICYNSIGDTYRLKKDYTQALKYLKRALVLNEKTRDRINVSSSYTILGETYLQVYDYDNAITNLKEGLAIAEDIGSKYQIEICARLLADAYEKVNNLKASLAYLKISQAYKDSIFNEENLRHIEVMTAKNEADRAKSQIQQLHSETNLQKELISQQKKAIIYFAFFIIALIAATVLIYRQTRLKEGYKSILMQQRLLRSQMNPHFIFNALSAIQVFILENDMENSSRFLSDFARLMRQVLRSSQREYVTLEEETGMLNYYLKLQQLRFVQPFSYNIKFDKEIDPKNTLIPPMITQPFVENAVEHGLKSLEKNGLVEIRFSIKKNNLLIEIEDNGIGLAGSKMAKENGVKHESMAVQITNERLQVIEKVTKRPTSFVMIDQHMVTADKSGVLIKIEIPIIKPDSEFNSENKKTVKLYKN
ncbi:tetratricopeptide repeat-containing sensor histidine kinase [Saccharicrinis sp. GN24d3]|uniref:tetratricopeptide repeat-containing sensor histidine kinase n=1 Tax=Saccharicrinis sp. 156 TaxID=3417574 RepID=UPI003D34AE77